VSFEARLALSSWPGVFFKLYTLCVYMCVYESLTNFSRAMPTQQPQVITTHSVDEKKEELLLIMHELSVLLDCGLDRTALSACLELLESGATTPEALAVAIQELRRQS